MTDNIPQFRSNKFRCPDCQTVSQQDWFDKTTANNQVNQIVSHLFLNYRTNIQDYQQSAISAFLKVISSEFNENFQDCVPPKFAIAICLACNDISLWVDREIVHPRKTSVDPPNSDLNNEIKALYQEAAIIYGDSPKGTAAILRLALQKLLVQIGKNGKDINSDIKELVASGLSVKVQQSLDLLRVIGNNAVHPGQINLDDDEGIALKLFQVLNFIANELITKPKEIESLFNDVVPDTTKEHIKQRDKNN